MTDKVTDVTISRGVSGMGTSGVCRTALTFKIPLSEYGGYSSKAPQCFLNVKEYHEASESWSDLEFPNFYVDTRVSDGEYLTVTCYDKLAFTDGYFYDEDISGESVNVTDVVGTIVSTLGLAGSETSKIVIGSLAKAIVEGQSYTSILSAAADLNCGFWQLSNDNKLKFAKYCDFTSAFFLEDNTDIIDLGEIEIDGYSFNYSGYNYCEGSGYKLSPSVSNVADIEDYINLLSGIASDQTYVMWTCSTTRCHTIPEINSYISATKFINNISVKVSAGGMFASVGRNQMNVSEINDFSVKNREKRNAEAKIANGQMCGKMMISSRYGPVYVSEEASS